MAKTKNRTADKSSAPASEAAAGGRGLSRAVITAIAVSVIVVAAFVAYHNSFGGPFVFDDRESIVENPAIRHLGTAFDPPEQLGTTIAGRPLLALSFALNYAMGGLDVTGYHVVNFALHVLAGLALFGVMRRILGSPRLRERFGADATTITCVIAVLWVIHPLQTESVTYIVQRAECLAGLFYLFTLYAAVRAFGLAAGSGEGDVAVASVAPVETASSPRPRQGSTEARVWCALSIVACLLGLASKEVLISAPIVVFLCDWIFFAGTFRAAWRKRWLFHSALALTWVLLGWLVWQTGVRGGTVGTTGDVTWWTYLLKQCEAIVHYLRLVIWPRPLVLDYGSDVVRTWTAVWPQAVALVLLAAGTVFALVRRPAMGFAGVCFFALLAPTSSVVPVVTQTMAEHRMYLPLAVLLAAFVVVLWRFLGRRSVLALAPLAFVFLILSVYRNNDYASEVSIWRDTAEKRPGNARAHSALGAALLREGKAQEAIAPLEQTLAIDPTYVIARASLGNALLQLKRVDDAIAQFRIVVQTTPGDFKAHGNLGNALLAAGRFDESIEEQRTMVRLAPQLAETHYNLALSLSRAGRHKEAIDEFQAALRIAPDHAEALLNLATSLAFTGRADEAIDACRNALRLRPEWVEAHCNLGLIYALKGRLSDAIASYEEALRLAPGRDDVRRMLQQLRLQAGR